MTKTVLITPSTFKRYREYRGLDLMFTLAHDAMATARRVLFFGYSFPQTDSAIEDQVRSAIGHSGGPLEIGIIDLNPSVPAAKIRHMLHNRSPQATFTELKVPEDPNVEPDWMRIERL